MGTCWEAAETHGTFASAHGPDLPYGSRIVARLSVVIPVRDDADMLRGALPALAEQTGAADEVIVVDNGSADDGAEVAALGGARVVSESRRGIPAATARGFDAATGEVLVRMDADSRPPADWLERIERALEAEPGLAAVT